MTPEEIGIFERIFVSITEGDKPFMALFAVIMFFVIIMTFKVMGYVRSVSDSHKEQITAMNTNMKEQREDHYKMVAEDRIRSDKRENELFINLEKNTQQLEGIADYLEKEIESVKVKVSQKESHE
jgi:lipopolysaccharide export LptBFGC system permease protein LptF